MNNKQLLSWLNEKINRDARLLDDRPIITDSGRDITDNIAGKLHAYIAVKYYVERGICDEEIAHRTGKKGQEE